MLAEWTGEDEFRAWSRRERVATERYRRILERLRAEAVIARAEPASDPLLAFGCTTLARPEARMASSQP